MLGISTKISSIPFGFKEMENLKKLQISNSTLLIFAILCLFPTSILSTNNESSYNSDGGFSYDPCSHNGPDHWGYLKEEWEVCKNGRMQSPISLTWLKAKFDRNLGVLMKNYRPGVAILKNNGHDVSVVWQRNAGSIQIHGIRYHLENFHWHHPSEHTLDGKRFPLELHMVHTNYNPNVTNNIAVVAVLFEFGPPDPFLSGLENDIIDLNIGGGESWLGVVDPRNEPVDGKIYYRYIGSLTTPPCSEGVIWTIDLQIKTVSPGQVEILKQAVVEEMNARPLQKINDRNIFYYNPYLRGKAAE